MGRRGVRGCTECEAVSPAGARWCARCGASMEGAETYYVPESELPGLLWSGDLEDAPRERRAYVQPSEYRRKAQIMDYGFLVAALVLTLLGSFSLAVVVLFVGVMVVYKPWRRRR